MGAAIHIKHGYAFKGQYFSDTGKYIVLTPGNFHECGGFRLREGKDRFYAGDIPEDFVLRNTDLIVAMTEQGPGLLGSPATIPEDDKFLHNQRLGLVTIIDKSLLDKRFLYHLFNTANVRGQISGSATGTKVRHTAPERIYRVRVNVPRKLDEQAKIASILDTYDDLLENNRRRIQLLEESARSLYKEWFVHLRFPGHEHTIIVDGVPEGWAKKPLIDVADLVMGQSPASEHYNTDGNGLPFHQGVTAFGDRFVSNKFYCTLESRIAKPGDILFSVRAPVGRINITLDRIVIGRGLAAIRSKCSNQSFLYYQLKAHFFKEDMIGGGAIFAAVTKKDMETQLLLQPPQTLIDNFEEIAEPIDSILINLHIQNERLKSARDLLLPRLMNGTITV